MRHGVLLLTIVVAAAMSGCTSTAPGNSDPGMSQQDLYARAYYAGIEHYHAGQSHFNNGTVAWEKGDYKQAISDYADAAAAYGDAARDYEAMSRHASGEREENFGEALRQWSAGMSSASSDFMESAIMLQKEDLDRAYASFARGHEKINASDGFLRQSANHLPGWLQDAGNKSTG